MAEFTLKPPGRGWDGTEWHPATFVPVPLTGCTIPWSPPYQAMPQQGWQCPVCKNVYAPFTQQCLKCWTQGTVTTTTTSSIPEKP